MKRNNFIDLASEVEFQINVFCRIFYIQWQYDQR